MDPRARPPLDARASRHASAPPPPPPPLPLRAPPPPPPVPMRHHHQFHHHGPPTSSAPADVDVDADALRSMPKEERRALARIAKALLATEDESVKAELAAELQKRCARAAAAATGTTTGTGAGTAPARSMVPTSSAYVFEPSSRPVFVVDAPTRARRRAPRATFRARRRRRPNAQRGWIARSDSRARRFNLRAISPTPKVEARRRCKR